METEMPKILYKYKPLNEYTDKLLFEGDLYFPSIGQLNDPFEGSIPYILDPKELTTEKIFQYMYELARRSNPTWSDEQVYKFVTKEVEKDLLHNEKHIEQQNKENREEVERLFGILSLTNQRNNFLMWSHYADSHKGICIGFDVEKIFNVVLGSLGEVIYSKDLPIKHLNSDVTEFMQNLLLTKSKVWEYENEYRLIKMNGARKTYSIPFDSILEITFGCKVSLEEKERIIKQMSDKNPSCIFYNSSLSKTKFELVTTQI